MVSRVSSLEKTGLKFPDLSNKKTLVQASGDIVPGWNNKDITYISLTVPGDGWIAVKAHAENHESQDLGDPENFVRRRITVKLNNSVIAEADATSGEFKTHLEDTDCVMVPVKNGNIVSYGSDTNITTNMPSPNGYYNGVTITWFGLLK